MKKKKSSGQTIDEYIRKTIVFGDNAYGISDKKISEKEIRKAKEMLDKGISMGVWRVSYMPSWAKKYPMWLNTILFWLFNNKVISFKWEKYL